MSSSEPSEGSPVRRIRIHHHTTTGGLWFAGWLFTVGFAHLGFWQAVLALVIWPYDLGVHLEKFAQ
jgi:hypothetical protein